MLKTSKALAIATIGIALACATSCSVFRHGSKNFKPSETQIAAALDSICAEGYNLFISERVNWVASDSALANYSTDDFGGNITWQPNDSTWSAVFLDKQQENCIFELRYNLRSGQQSITYTPRPITAAELQEGVLQNTMFENALERYGDSLLYNSSYGRPNFDFIRIDANTIRLYILQGVERPNIIPFGNDYSIDFDNKGNAKTFRRYHHSFLPMPTVDDNGERVRSLYHSHTKDNPYITPTDICNFLLYRGEMNQTFVYSTALNGYIIYNAESNQALFMTKEAMDKITNSQH